MSLGTNNSNETIKTLLLLGYGFALPLIPLIVLSHLVFPGIFDFNSPFKMYHYVIYKTPYLFIDKLGFFWGLFLLLFVFVVCPTKYKKNLLLVYTFSSLIIFFGFWFSCVILLSLLAIWIAFQIKKTHRDKYSSPLIFVAFGGLLAGVYYFPQSNILFSLLLGNIILSVYSTHREISDYELKVNLNDCLLYWIGFPVNFFAVPYTHREFVFSFLNKEYLEIVKDGLKSIFLGLSKIIIGYIVSYLTYPYWSISQVNISNIAVQYPMISKPSLLLIALFIAIFFIFFHAGVFQVFQGISKLFGFGVRDHVTQPWLSISFLDFWKRQSWHTRNYMLRYIFFPTFIRWRNFYLSVILIWLLFFLLRCVSLGVLQTDTLKADYQMEVILSNFSKFVILFAHAVILDVALIKIGQIKKVNGPAFMKSISLIRYLLFIFVLLLGHEILPSISTPFFDNLENLFNLILR